MRIILYSYLSKIKFKLYFESNIITNTLTDFLIIKIKKNNIKFFQNNDFLFSYNKIDYY